MVLTDGMATFDGLTEPVQCSTCGAVSVNGGTLHCHHCYETLRAEIDRLTRERDDLAAKLASLDVLKWDECKCGYRYPYKPADTSKE